MKKRRYFAGAAAILFLLLFCGFAPQSITEDKDAQVLLYETYGENEILVYTGRTTVLYRPAVVPPKHRLTGNMPFCMAIP